MAKVGKPRNINSPEELYDLFEEYSKDCKSRIRRIPKATVKGVVNEDHTPPLTIDGFKTYSIKTNAILTIIGIMSGIVIRSLQPSLRALRKKYETTKSKER